VLSSLRTRSSHFASLFFNVPGAADLGADELDFHGALALRAKVSQTMTDGNDGLSGLRALTLVVPSDAPSACEASQAVI
jgi:hypothetical protein